MQAPNLYFFTHYPGKHGAAETGLELVILAHTPQEATQTWQRELKSWIEDFYEKDGVIPWMGSCEPKTADQWEKDQIIVWEVVLGDLSLAPCLVGWSRTTLPNHMLEVGRINP